MKIVVALNNKLIMDELVSTYKDKVYEHDIYDKENVIKYLEENKDNNQILVTKDTLDGILDRRLYIKAIKNICPNIKIIYIVEKLDMEYKQFLFANEVINIIEGEVIDVDNIKETIDTNRFIVYKNQEKNESINNFKKESIAICGTSGAGKSVVASLIAKELAKNLNKSVALLDMNVNNPSIDIINNLEVNTNVLGQIVEDVDKYSILNKKLNTYLLKDAENKKLSYMTNSFNEFEIKNKKYSKYYDFVINKLNSEFDLSIIDLPSIPFLDVVNYSLINASKILFVINPNYISVRQAAKQLNILTNLYNIDNSKIGLVINKVTKNSLDNLQIRTLLKGYKIVLNLNYDKNVEALINGEFDIINLKNNFNKVYNFLEIDIRKIYLQNANMIRKFLMKEKLSKISSI